MTGAGAHDSERAREIAIAALARRDVSVARLQERLRSAGIESPVADETLAALARTGLVDDGRLAARRADALAAKGYGNAVIELRLKHEGLCSDEIREALANLAPEEERAHEAVRRSRSSDRRRVAGFLSRRGFCEEAIEGTLTALDVPRGPKLR